MQIVIDRTLPDEHVTGFSFFVNDLISALAIRYPRQLFHVLAWQQNGVAGLPSNVAVYSVNSWFLKLFGRKWWYRYRLPGTIKKLDAALLLCFDNLYAPVAGTPSFLFLSPSFAGPESGKHNRSFNTRFAAACRRSRAVITFSAYHLQQLKARYPALSEKLVCLKPGTGQAGGPFTQQERETAKASYARGLEYFAFAGDLHQNHQLTELLKAFSIFKKWQRSNMQLVFAGSATPQTNTWLQALDSYKYKADVHVLKNPSKETLLAVIAGAYAFVYPAVPAHVPVNILHAMQLGVPVITSRIPCTEEVAGQCAMYAAQSNGAAFAACLQAVYKDEHLRDSLAAKGRKQAENAGADMAEQCWTILEKGLSLKS